MDIKQIANRAGVSASTVSRAINQPHLVNEQTREKVLKIVEEMNYVPNPFAKSLLTGKTYTIALVVPTLNNPVFGQLAEGAESVLASKGYSLVTYSSIGNMRRYQTILENIDKRKVDGIILAGSGVFQEGYQEPLQNIKNPIVAVEYLPDQSFISCIYVDDTTGVRMAIEHLVHLGHKNIGLITGTPKMIVTKRRLKAATKALADHDLEIKKEHIVSGTYDSIESGYFAMQKLLDTKPVPSAIFAFNDILAVGALKCSQDLGYKVPEDISVIGFDDIPLGEYIHPGLTTVHQPSFELGENAAKMILSHIEKPNLPIRKTLLPAQLILRGSVAAKNA